MNTGLVRVDGLEGQVAVSPLAGVDEQLANKRKELDGARTQLRLARGESHGDRSFRTIGALGATAMGSKVNQLLREISSLEEQRLSLLSQETN